MYVSIIEPINACDGCNQRRPLCLTTYANCTPGYGANGTPILAICSRCQRIPVRYWVEYAVTRARITLARLKYRLFSLVGA